MIIVNADDFGISDIVNQAIIRSFEFGIVSSTTIMANMPAFDNAVDLAYKNKITDCIGLHFNLMEGTPLTATIRECPRLCKDGENLSYKRNSVFRWSKKEKIAIREEFCAQYDKVVRAGIIPTHLDSHLHVHTEIPLFLVIRDLIKDKNICKIRRSRNLGVSVKVMPYKYIINTLYRMSKLTMTRYFTEYETQNRIINDIELMCHPTIDLKTDNLIDAMTGKQLSFNYPELISYKDL